MDLSTALSHFYATIADSKWWQRFKGSEFVTYLASYIAQMAKRAEIAASRRLQESFLSQAVNDTSVLAGSESRGYVPIKRIPNRKVIAVTNTTGSMRTLLKGTALFAEANGLPYLVTQTINVPAGGTIQAECIQAERKLFSSTVVAAEKFMTRLLDPDTSDRIASFDVYVTEPYAKRKKWEPTALFRNANKDSNVYVEFYTPSEQLGIRFGNGLLGRIPVGESLIEIDCVLTDGATDISAGIPLIITSEPALNSTFKIFTGETLAVGSEREDIESIRQNALYYPSYDESLVWGNDHVFFIRRNIPTLSWISVWGEAEQEKLAGASSISFINSIYIAAHHPTLTQDQVRAQIEALYKHVKSYNTTFKPVSAVYEAYTVTVTGKTLSSNKPELVIEQLQSALKAFTLTAAKQPATITPDALWSAIRDTGLLTSFSLSVAGVDLMSKPAVNAMRHLNIAGSVFNVTY